MMKRRDPQLDDLLAASRAHRRQDDRPSSGAEGLSDDARNRIRESIRTRRRLPELRPLFTPLSHWAYAAGIPALTAAVMVGVWSMQTPQTFLVADAAPAEIRTFTQVEVVKRDGKVIFLTDGEEIQSIRKSSDPRDFSAAEMLRQDDGAFEDSLSSNGSIVFYRID